MSNTILNLWSSGKLESRSIVALVGATDLFTAAFAISTWVASSSISLLPGSTRFYMVWTSFIVIGVATALTAFIVHLPLRTELMLGVVLGSVVCIGQVLLTWAVQYSSISLASFTAMAIFAWFLVITLHGAAGVLWYSRLNLLPTIFKEGAVSNPTQAKEPLPPA